MKTRATLLVLAACAAACHFHRDTNAPGDVELQLPPRQLAEASVELPGEPGEHMITLTSGALAGGGGRFGNRGAGVGDFAAEVSLDWGETDFNHNDHASRMFIPRGALWPQRGYGVTLGWSALRIISLSSGQDDRVETGPIYVEGQRLGPFWGVGGGWAVQPTTGHQGPQVNAFVGFFFMRARYLIDDGFELHIGYQLKIPTTWVWSK